MRGKKILILRYCYTNITAAATATATATITNTVAQCPWISNLTTDMHSLNRQQLQK